MIVQEEEASFGRLTIFSIYTSWKFLVNLPSFCSKIYIYTYIPYDVKLKQVDQGSQGLKEGSALKCWIIAGFNATWINASNLDLNRRPQSSWKQITSNNLLLQRNPKTTCHFELKQFLESENVVRPREAWSFFSILDIYLFSVSWHRE